LPEAISDSDPFSSTRFQSFDPPPAAFYNIPDEAIQAVNLWAEPRGHAIVKGRIKYRKYGSK
jgi:hypothetical protein